MGRACLLTVLGVGLLFASSLLAADVCWECISRECNMAHAGHAGRADCLSVTRCAGGHCASACRTFGGLCEGCRRRAGCEVRVTPNGSPIMDWAPLRSEDGAPRRPAARRPCAASTMQATQTRTG